MAQHGKLPGPEVEALVKRFLEAEVGVTIRPLKGGLGFLCTGPLGTTVPTPWLFAVATVGGILLRLDDETRERLIENGVGRPNVALPEWLTRLDGDEAPRADHDTIGEPDEWVWVPIDDSAMFERRRPHIVEALSYCRHRLAAPRAD